MTTPSNQQILTRLLRGRSTTSSQENQEDWRRQRAASTDQAFDEAERQQADESAAEIKSAPPSTST